MCVCLSVCEVLSIPLSLQPSRKSAVSSETSTGGSQSRKCLRKKYKKLTAVYSIFNFLCSLSWFIGPSLSSLTSNLPWFTLHLSLHYPFTTRPSLSPPSLTTPCSLQELTGHQSGNPRHSVPIDTAFVNMISHANFHSNQ